MAGRGPAQADPEQRRRTNTRDFEILPAAGNLEFPPLPKTFVVTLDESPADGEPLTVEIAYSDETIEWYETWGRSPQATRFVGTDWQRLKALAPLREHLARQPGHTKLLAELRLQETLLGATVMDRQRLGQRVEIATPDYDAGKAGAGKVTSLAAARRKRLVKPAPKKTSTARKTKA